MVKVALKSVLRDFLNHFERLESIHKLSESNDNSSLDEDLYQREFQALKELTESLKTDPNCSSQEGERDVNKRKNRYKDILPYDRSRVILSEYPGVPGSDYINANFVRGSSSTATRAYIASQGPLPNTVVDFWRMIWECDVSVIVMACNEREAGKYKCESYWPQDNEHEQQYGNISVELVKWRQVCPDFLVRTLKVKSDSKEPSRIVCQFHYQSWPDHGVPTSVHPILELVRLMRDVQSSETRPILVHCSAGCGRTGTICSIDYVWALLRTGKIRDDFSLYTIISEMRKQRIAMVQTLEQYMLCYKAVATLFEQQLKMIDTHTYENIDEDGEPIFIKEFIDNDNYSSLTSSLENDDMLKMNKKEKNEVFSKVQNLAKHSNMSNNNSFISSNTQRNCDEVRHEKLVGKATVIRRPSIAKLKAIFENQAQVLLDPPLVRSKSAISNLQRSHSIKEMPRNFRSMAESNINDFYQNTNEPIYGEQHINYQSNNSNNESSDEDSHLYVEYSVPSQSQNSDHSLQNNQNKKHSESPFNSNIYSPLSDEKYYSINQQQSQQQQQQQHMRANNMQMQQQLPQPPPKPPRTYQHVVRDSPANYVPNSLDGRRLVSVALPRRQPNVDNRQNELGRRHISSPNLVSDSLIVNNKIEHCSNYNATKVINLSNTNIYESVLPNFANRNLSQQNENNYSGQYIDVMKIRNSDSNNGVPQQSQQSQQLPHSQSQPQQPPLYNTIYCRPGFLTVPNVRHVPLTSNQMQSTYSAYKPNNYENIYTSLNNTNETRIKDKHKVKSLKSSDKMSSNCYVSEQVSNHSKLDNKDRKENNSNSVSKSNQKTDANKNVNVNSSSSYSESNSGRFTKFTNAFKGFRFKSTKNKSKINPNNANNISAQNNSNGTTISRPPHSHRFSPPTQWTQV